MRSPATVAWLHRALAHEWAAAAQFSAQAALARAAGDMVYADFSRRAAADELEHAQWLADAMAARSWTPRPAAVADRPVGQGVAGMLAAAIETEQRAVALYEAAARDCAGDPGLHELMNTLAEQEREHLLQLQRWPRPGR